MAQVIADHEAKCWRWPVVVDAPRAPVSTGATHLRAASRGLTLIAEHVSKHYGGAGVIARRLSLGASPVQAVDDVSFEVQRDEVLALVGESGCGKSTLGRVVARLLRPTTGVVRFLDRASGAEVMDEAVVRRTAQIVFQHPDSSLNPVKRVGHAVARPLALQGMKGARRRGRLRELFHAVRLDASFARRLPRELSGGEKQRVAIARAIAQNPSLILADEPVASLDPELSAQVLADLARVARDEGVPTIINIHAIELARAYCDRIVGIAQGVVVYDSSIGGLDEATMDRIYRFDRPSPPAMPWENVAERELVGAPA
jgi:ABC-type glutathione transport system ATPase component